MIITSCAYVNTGLHIFLFALVVMFSVQTGCAGEAPAAEATPTPMVEILRVPPSGGEFLFPRQPPPEGMHVSLTAELIGKLHPRDGCLRLADVTANSSYLPIWPSGYTVAMVDGEIVILNEVGQISARFNDYVYIGGGVVGSSPENPLAIALTEAGCPGPFWLVGDRTRIHIWDPTEPLIVDQIEIGEHPFYLLRWTPALDDWLGDAREQLVGQLVIEDGCIWVDAGETRYLPVWPLSHVVTLERGLIEIMFGGESGRRIVGTVGETVALYGFPITLEKHAGRFDRLQQYIPSPCAGPYWLVTMPGRTVE